MERKCCAFLRFSLVVTPGEGPVWLELTGPDGTQELLSGILEVPEPIADLGAEMLHTGSR
jgi:hypothetical protein